MEELQSPRAVVVNFLSATHLQFIKRFQFLLFFFITSYCRALTGRDQAFFPDSRMVSKLSKIAVCHWNCKFTIRALSQILRSEMHQFINAVPCQCATPKSRKARLESCVFEKREGGPEQLVTFFSSVSHTLVLSTLVALQHLRICEPLPPSSLLCSGVVSLLLWWQTEIKFLTSARERVRESTSKHRNTTRGRFRCKECAVLQ